MQKADLGVKGGPTVSFTPIFNTVIIYVHIIPKIFGRLVVKTVINAARVDEKQRDMYALICAIIKNLLSR